MKTLFKHRKLTLFLSLYLIINLFSTLSAQKDSIKWGIEQEYLKRGIITHISILKTDSNSIYFYCSAYKMLSTNYFIVKHEKKTGLNSICDIQFKQKEYTLNFINHVYADGTLHIFSTFYNKKLDKLFVFHETYNIEKQQSNNDINKVTEIDYTALAPEGTTLQRLGFEYINNRFLFRYACKAKKGQIFGLEVFDKKLNKEWSNPSIALTETGINYEGDYQIDKDGNVYALQRNFENEKDVNKHFEHSRIWAVCYPKGGVEPKSLALILKDDYFITGKQLSVNEKGEVICAGLYAKPGTTSAVGCFSFVIEPLLLKIKSVNTKEFSTAMLTKGQNAKEQQKEITSIVTKKDFDNDFGYNIDSIHIRRDGSFDVVAEKFKEEIITRNDFTTYYYYYDDLMVLTYNADGSIKWVQKIPKFEYLQDNALVTGGYFLSYDKEDNMTFIFNLMNSGNSIYLTSNGKTIRLTLDQNGKENFKEIIGDNRIAQTICPQFFFKQDDNTLVLTKYFYDSVMKGPRGEGFAGKKNKITFGELNLK